MADITTRRCPVCGTLADSTKKNIETCPVCDAHFAFVQYFADRNDIPVWREKMEEHKLRVLEQTCRKQFGRSSLSLGDRAAAVVTHGSQFLLRSNSDTEETLKNVLQISFGGRHCLLLFEDGHVEARMIGGRRADQGQSRVDDWSDVSFVEAGANCSYGVRLDGTVLVSGIPTVPSEEILHLQQIKALAEGEGFLVFLTVDGQLRLLVPAGAPQGLKDLKKAVIGCHDIVSVEASQGCVMALDRKGQVHSFCSASSDPRLRADGWTDIVMIATDSHYAIGLTSKGKLRLVGRESSMDAGRKDVSAWEDNVALACAPTGIGAIALDGTLRLAGNIIGAKEIQQAFQPYAQRIATAIIQN